MVQLGGKGLALRVRVQFKQECSVLFDGPLSEMKGQQKTGLIINWIRRAVYHYVTLNGYPSRQAKYSVQNTRKNI